MFSGRIRAKQAFFRRRKKSGGGSLFINSVFIHESHPLNLPFGGMKKMGKESIIRAMADLDEEGHLLNGISKRRFEEEAGRQPTHQGS